MLKKIRKSFLISIMSIVIALASQPVVLARVEIKPSLQEQMELIQNDIKVDDLDIEPINTQDLKNNVIPNSKQEGQKVLFLFLKTMFAVALTSGIIYVILLFIRKYRSSDFVEMEYDEYAILNLATPTNKQDAFLSFLNRTSF